jgi:hypothetical protein
MMHGSMRHTTTGRKKSYNAWSTKKKPTPRFQPMEVTSEPYRRETPVYKSCDSGTLNTQIKERLNYTGTLVKGISTMHKSNAVPIINQEEAIEHARMRR